MQTSEEQKRVDPVKELMEYVQDFCTKNGLQCFSMCLLKSQTERGIGCVISGKLEDLVSAMCEVMERDEHATRVITEVFSCTKAKQVLKKSDSLDDLLKMMMS